MKTTLVLFSVVAVSLNPAFVRADIVYAKSSLWRSPVPTGISVTAAPSAGADFGSACVDFENEVAKFKDMLADSSVAPSLHDTLDQARRQALKSQFPSSLFQARFKLDLSANGNLLTDNLRAQLASTVAQVESTDALPHQTMTANAFLLSASGLSNVTSNASADSLSRALVPAGLSALPVLTTFVPGDGYYVTMYSRDAACDLASGRLTLHLHGTAYAELSLNDQAVLRSYYIGLSQIGEAATTKYSEPVRRAAALGYRLGTFYTQAFPQDGVDAIDALIDGTLDAYFTNATLDLNGLWKKGLDGHAELQLNADSDPIAIQIDTTGAGAQ